MGFLGGTDVGPLTLALLALFVVVSLLLGGVALGLLRALRRARRGEAAARESDDRLREVTDAAQDAIVLIDDRGRVTFWNRAAERVFGYARGEALGRELHRLVAPARFQDDYESAFPRFAATGNGTVIGKTLELRAVCKGGAEFPVELSLGAVRLSSGWHAIGVVRDITDRKALEERERRLVAELREKVEELDAFTWRVSHDLKAPLRSLRGWCDVLADALDGIPDATAHDLLGRITRGAGKMDTLISRLLSLSRAGRQAVEREPIRLERLVGDVRADLAAALRERGASVETDAGRTTLSADPGLLTEVFTNLVGNAVKFNERPAPSVRVGVRGLPCGASAVYVEDDGIGVPPEQRERVFRAFERAHGNGYEGSGAGLAICRRIVEAHGGRIWVESNDTGGSTFLFTLGPDGVAPPPRPSGAAAPVRDAVAPLV